jgi:hypothetical protein
MGGRWRGDAPSRSTTRLTIALVPALAAALLLLAGIGPSLASATALCAQNEESCSAGNTYGVPAELEFKLKSGTQSLYVGSVEIACGASTAKAETTEESGSLLVGKITALSFSSCEGGCTAEAKNLPYKTETSATGGGNGSVKVTSGGSGNPRTLLKCLGIECTFGSASMELEADGGEPGLLVAKEEPMTKEAGSFLCGSTSTWSATYEAAELESLFIVNAGEPTMLCRKVPTKDKVTGELICDKNERYLGGIAGTIVPGSKVKFTELAKPNSVIECTESTLKGVFGANGSSAIGGGFTGMTFNSGGGKECTSTIPKVATVSLRAENLPFNNSKLSYLQAEPNPQGAATFRKLKAATQIELKAGGSTCTYKPTTTSGNVTNPAGTVPMILDASGNWKIVKATAPCPEEMVGVFEWVITQTGGGNLWITEREAK